MNTFLLFLICVLAGFGLGFVYNSLHFFKLLAKHNIIICNIINFLFSLLYGFVILLVVVNLNYGEFRMFLILGFAIGTFFELKTLGKLFAKLINWLYNKLCKACCALQKTKLYKKVTK